MIKNYPRTHVGHPAGVQYLITLSLNIVCALLPILLILADFLSGEVKLYETIANGYIALAWVCENIHGPQPLTCL